jgi:RNA recognition motif-containing protein
MKQNKVYVGNLLSSLTSADIETEFSKYGQLENVQLITDPMTGVSRGFAFLTFEKQVSAETALEMNGKPFNGRNLVVNMAKEKSKGFQRKRY